MPVQMRPAQIDFSQLATMGQNIGGAIGQHNFGQALAGVPKGPDGNTDYNAMMDVIMARRPDLGAKMLTAQQGIGGASVYGTPIPFRKPDGSIGVGAIGKDGSWHEVPMTGPYVQGTKLEDFGGYKQPYQYGLPVAQPTPVTGSPPAGYVPPQNDVPRAGVGPEGGYMPGTSPSETAAAAAEGKELGTNLALYKSMTSKLPGLYQVAKQLEDLSDKATYTATGRAYDFARKEVGAAPTEGAVARTEYMAVVDNQVLPLLRDTFGAAFTVQEGESLRATLGDPNKSPPEKQAVLRAFIAQKVRDVQALAVQTGQSAPQVPQQPAGPSESGTPVPRSADENQEMVAHARAQMASGLWSVDDAIKWLRLNGIDVEDDR